MEPSLKIKCLCGWISPNISINIASGCILAIGPASKDRSTGMIYLVLLSVTTHTTILGYCVLFLFLSFTKGLVILTKHTHSSLPQLTNISKITPSITKHTWVRVYILLQNTIYINLRLCHLYHSQSLLSNEWSVLQKHFIVNLSSNIRRRLLFGNHSWFSPSHDLPVKQKNLQKPATTCHTNTTVLSDAITTTSLLNLCGATAEKNSAITEMKNRNSQHQKQ